MLRGRRNISILGLLCAMGFGHAFAQASSQSLEEEPEKTSLLDIPSSLKDLEIFETHIRKEIDKLPVLDETVQFEAYGYHGGYLPALEELPAEPRWTVQFEFWPYVSLTKVIFVPAIDHRFGELGSYGFPRRFKVFRIGDDGSETLIEEWMDEDCPDPGRFPHVLNVVTPYTHRIRIDVYRGAEDGTQELFAMDEMFGVMGVGSHECKGITASSSFESLPYWGLKYLTDQRTGLGLPLDVSGDSDQESDDFTIVFDKAPKDGCIIELDMGQNRQLGWVSLFPAQAPEGIMIPGYGFPGQVILEFVPETSSGKRGKIQIPEDQWKPISPGNNVVRLPGSNLSGRWLRLRLSDLPVHNGKSTFAMGEIHVYAREETYPIQGINLLKFPEGAEEQVHLLYDAKSRGNPILFLFDWYDQLDQRNRLSGLLEGAALEKKVLEERWERFVKVGGFGGLGLLVLISTVVALVAIVQRRKQLKDLKWRITRDLHDEVGSTLGSISLTALQLERNVSDEEAKEDLTDLSLMALEACASLKEVVWMIDENIILLPGLVQKMTERARQVLRAMEVTVQTDPSLPNLEVSLTFKRHLIMLFKEVIHNCARHSEATAVSISFLRVGDQFELTVVDDGCGFDPEQKSGGWGLGSMKDRAVEMSGSLLLSSTLGEGTSIKVIVPLDKLSKEPDNAYSTSN